MNNTTNHNLGQIEQADLLSLPVGEALILDACKDFVEQGITGDKLRKALQQQNGYNTLDPVSQDFIDNLVSQFPDKPDPITTAIASGDRIEVLKVAPQLAALPTIERGIFIEEIKAKYPSLNGTLRSALADEKRKAKIAESDGKDVADIAQEWTSHHADMWAYDANYDVWRVWTGRYWQEQAKNHLLDKYAKAALQENGKDINNQAGLNTFERIAEAYAVRDFDAKPGLINFDNGTLDIATRQLAGFEKDDNLTYCLDYAYNPHGSHNAIDAFLADVLPDSFAVAALMAHVGLSLMGDLNMHYFYCMIGSTRSGKSTILALINATCGAMDPKMFAGHSIFSRDVEGKRSRFKWSQKPIVCIDELPSEALREEELLKAMSAHSGVEMRGIGKDEQTNNRWKPKLVMATNDQPRYNDTSSAIKERAVFVELGHTIPKANRDARLFDKLSVEIGAWVVDCLDLAAQVLDIGFYPLSASMKELLDRIANEGNPLKDFVRTEAFIDGKAETRISTKTLHDEYKRYCDEHGHTRPMAANRLSTQLRTLDNRIITPAYPIRIDGKMQRGLQGIRLRTFEDPEVQPVYEDDPALRLRCLQREKSTVDASNQPDKPSQDALSTMSTVESAYFSQYKNELQVSKYIAGYRDENDRRSRRQGGVEQPDKPSQGVYDTKKPIVDIVDGRVHTCGNCHSVLPDDSKIHFCPGCGGKIVRTPLCAIDGCEEEYYSALDGRFLCVGHLAEEEYKLKTAKAAQNGRASR